MRRTTHEGLVVACATLALCLSGCGSGSGRDDGSAAPAEPRGTGTFGEALAVLPSDLGPVVFRDVRGAALDAGFDRLTSEAPLSEQQDYVTASAQFGHAQSRITPAFGQMQGWSFNVTDVVWEADVVGGHTVIVLRDGVDMDGVVADFVKAGYQRTDAGEVVDLRGDLDAEPTVGPLLMAAVIPSQNIIVAGALPRAVGEVLTSDVDRLGDDATVTELLAAIDGTEPQWARLRAGDAACGDGMTSGTAPARLGALDGSVVTIDADGGSIVTVHPDEETAEADASARTTYLNEGRSGGLSGPYADVLDVGEASVEGRRVSYPLDVGSAERLPLLVGGLDEPWAVCPGYVPESVGWAL